MAKTLADIRAEYPQYDRVDDKTLADALYTKYYGHADRREFDARIGLNPYDNPLEVAGKALAGTPGNIMTGISGMTQMAREGEAGNPNKVLDVIGPEFKTSDVPAGGTDLMNFGSWVSNQMGIDPHVRLTKDEMENYARKPGVREEYAKYLRTVGTEAQPEDVRYIGTAPTAVAKAELKGQLERQDYAKGIPQIDAAPGSVESILGSAVGSVAQMAPGYAAAILTRSPLPTVALAQALTSGQSYADARDAGVDPRKAAEYAVSNGFAEAVGEALPLGEVLKEGGKILPKLFKAGVSEAAQETVTQFIQSMLESGTVTPDMTWGDVKQQVIAAAATGALAGGVLTSGEVAIEAAHNRGKKATEISDQVFGDVVTADAPDTPAVEDQMALPAPATLLALPAPDAPPVVTRRQPAAPAQTEPTKAPEQEADYQARVALRKTRQAETAALLQTARETVQPLGSFTREEVDAAVTRRGARQERRGVDGELFVRYSDAEPWVRMDHFGDGGSGKQSTRTVNGRAQVKYGENGQYHDATVDPTTGIISSPGADADMRRATGMSPTQRVMTWRAQTGRNMDAPITVEDMARAKVPQSIIDTVITARRPMTRGEVVAPKDIRAIADAKNIIANDDAFSELAFRTTGQRNIERMSQAQLSVLKSTIESLPSHETRVTLPIADAPAFDEGQYGKSLDAIRNQGRFTLSAIKDAAGVKDDKIARSIRDAMVRRGQLVQRGKNDFRLYDVLGQERQAVPDDLPPGAFSEYVVKKAPVNRIQIKVDGKSLGTFGSGTEARNKIRELRRGEAEKGGTPARIELGQAEESAYAVMENRYDENGTLLGQVAVDTSRDETAARKLAAERNNPDTGARYTQTLVTPEAKTERGAPPFQPKRGPAPAALAGRTDEVVAKLNALAKERGLPLLGTKVNIADAVKSPAGEAVRGMFLNNIISITAGTLEPNLTTDQVVDRLAQVMDHELIHALKRGGVLAPETAAWKTLSKYVSKTKRPDTGETYLQFAKRMYADAPGYTTEEDMIEEAIAEAFRVWAGNRRNVVGQPATAFRQLVEWFKRLFSALPEDVFSAIESGAMVREALTPPGAGQPRAVAAEEMAAARKDVAVAQAAKDENAVRVASRAFLRARDQAREDRLGRAGPKTVIGTTPSRAFAASAAVPRDVIDGIVDKYRASAGISTKGLATLLPEDIGYLTRVADAQQRAAHDPGANAVAKAYRALTTETRSMFDALGITEIARWTEDGQPYASVDEMFADMAAGRLKLRLSADMFGEGADNPGHPMYKASGIKAADGTPLVFNDLFRVVHDVYGRAPIGLKRDSGRDDYNAYHEHARLLSPDARKALATETLAQGAWHHYGPHLRRKDGTVPRERDVDYLPPERKEFAEQKAFLLDDKLVSADPGWALAEKADTAAIDAKEAIEELPKFSLPDDQVQRTSRPSEIGNGYGDYVTYTDKDTGAYMQVVERTGAARDVSVISFEVPEERRGKGVGRSLLGYVLRKHPSLMGQVSSKAAAKLAYDAGRRPWGNPDATLDEVLKRIDEDSSVNLLTVQEEPKFSLYDDHLPGGRLYGNAKRSPGGAVSAPDTAPPAFSKARDGNQFFGGDMANEQLRMAQVGERGTTLLYLSPDEFLALAGQKENPEQAVYDGLVNEGYKFNTMPSLILDGYAGKVRAVDSDGAYAVAALANRAERIPVAIYPKRGENLGLVSAIDGNGVSVPWPADGRAENFPDVRGPRSSVDLPAFKAWFGDSKVVNADGSPKVVFHGTAAAPFNVFHEHRPNFFAPDSSYAEGYNAKGSGLSRVIPVFLSIEHPFDPSIDAEATAIFNADFLAYLERRFPKRAENFKPLSPGQPLSFIDADLMFPFLRRRAEDIADGYDGMVVSEDASGTFGMSWVPLENTQIKSAVANKGTYDATNPDIRYSLNAPYGTRVPREQFNIIDQRVEGWVGSRLAKLGRSKRELPLPKGVKEAVGGTIFDMRVKFQDRMLSVKEMIEHVKAMGGTVTDFMDTYMAEQLAGSRTVQEVEHREGTLYEPLFAALEREGKADKPIAAKDLEDFLYARHAPERNAYLRAAGSKVANPSGMSDAEAEAILDKAALDGKLDRFEKLAAMVDAITADTTNTRVAAGLISQDSADQTPYQHYVPLRGKDAENLDPDDIYDRPARARSGKGYTVGGKEDRSAVGRSRKAGDILAAVMLQNTESVIRSEKNRVALSFMRLLQANPNSGFGTILKSAPTRMVRGADGQIREAGDPAFRNQPDIFTAKWKGKEIVARVEDPRVARAMRADYVQVGGEPSILDKFVAGASRLNRYLASINTSFNPEFLISNIARDAQTAAILGAQYDIKDFSRKIITGAPAAVLAIREVLRDGTASTPLAERFQEMQKAGGTTEFLGIHDLDTHIKRLRADAARTGWQPTARQAFNRIQTIGKFIDDYNKVAENAFRLGAYNEARNAGVSIDRAAFLAKNLTVNFNKGGEQKALMNSLYLFYNASISGTFVLLNGLKSKRVQKIVAGVVVAGIVMDALNRAMSGDDDDNGIKDYDDIPDYVLETNWVFMIPGSKEYVAIPMPYGFNFFHNLGRNLSNAVSGSPAHSLGKSAMSVLMTAINAFNPIGGANSPLNFIAPTFADPLVDLATNKDFAGNAIVPERPTFGLDVPDSQKYWANTGEIPKWTAEQLNRLTGGNEVRPGAVDVSPEVLQYWIDYATGATGKFVTRNVGLGMNVAAGNFEDIKIGDIPFARRVVGSVTSRGNTERYYENATEIKTVGEELDLAQETGNIDMMNRVLTDKAAEVGLIDTFKKAEKELSDTRKQIRELKADDVLPGAQKREMIRLLEEQQDTTMAQLNRLYYQTKGFALPPR